MSIHRDKCSGTDTYWTRKERSRVLFFFILHGGFFLEGLCKEGGKESERGEREGGGGMGIGDMHVYRARICGSEREV